MPAPIVALEVGTSKVVALVGEKREDGHIMITGMGEYPSSGLRKGEVIDYENAVVCTRGAIQAAEESGRVNIRQVYLAVSGGHIQSLTNRGITPVRGPAQEITQEDVDNVMDLAGSISLPHDREVLHSLCKHFGVDDQERVANPVGLEGARLCVDMLILHGVRNLLRNTVKVARGLQVDVADVAFAGLCSALAVVTPEQKRSGVLVIDLGGGTTDYFAYADNVVATAGCLGIGGDHVTNDIALAFNIPISQAESLKRRSGSALIDPLVMSQRVKIPAEMGFTGRSVSVKALHSVMNARLSETFHLIRAETEERGVLHQFGGGVILTGGGAHMSGIVELAEKELGLPCTIGKPVHVSGLSAARDRPQYASVVGMVEYGFRTMDEDQGVSIVPPWVKGLFRSRAREERPGGSR